MRAMIHVRDKLIMWLYVGVCGCVCVLVYVCVLWQSIKEMETSIVLSSVCIYEGN